MSKHFYKNKTVLILTTVMLLANLSALCQKSDFTAKPDTLQYEWERFSFKIGGFVAGMNSDIQLSSQQLGLGVLVNLEDALGLTTSTFVFRSEIEYNFGKNRRHSIKLDYFSLLRNAQKVLESDIPIGEITFPIGTEVNSKLNLDIWKFTYIYSFYLDRRVKLGASFGLFIMPTTFEIGALHLTNESAHFIAPLPVIGLNSAFAITPKLYLKQSVEFLYLDISNFRGAITDINMRVEYNIWKHFGFGLGINAHKLNIEALQEDQNFFDFKGTLKESYTGIFMYVRYYF